MVGNLQSVRLGDTLTVQLCYQLTVLILGNNYYCDQIVTIKNPQRVGTYSYTNKGGRPMTVPVIDGDINSSNQN